MGFNDAGDPLELANDKEQLKRLSAGYGGPVSLFLGPPIDQQITL